MLWGGRLSLFTCFYPLDMAIFGLLSLKRHDGSFPEECYLRRFGKIFAGIQKPYFLALLFDTILDML